MDIGREIDTRTITPVRRSQPAKPTRVPKRDWTPSRPAQPVKDPDKVPVKTPSK